MNEIERKKESICGCLTALGFMAAAGWASFDGVFATRGGHVSRDEYPVLFWCLVALFGLGGLAAAVWAIHDFTSAPEDKWAKWKGWRR